MKALSIILLFILYGCKQNFGDAIKVKLNALWFWNEHPVFAAIGVTILLVACAIGIRTALLGGNICKQRTI